MIGYFSSEDQLNSISYGNINRFHITATPLADTIALAGGNDTVIAGAGDDTIQAGGGNDVLVAFDPGSSTPGQDEQDRIVLGNGAVRVLLGSGDTPAYLNSTSAAASQDFLRIEGLAPAEDRLLLPGSQSDYQLSESLGSTEIYLSAAKSTHQNNDLIAVIDGLTGLSLSDNLFIYGSVAIPGATKPASSTWSLDIDGSSRLEPSSDIALLLRFGLGTFPGEALQQGISNPAATRTDLTAINQALASGISTGQADLDGNGGFEVMSDGLIAMAHSIGISANAIIDANLISNTALRQSPQELGTFLDGITPT